MTQARAAQDDMRAAFANLYLKGGADKLPPVEAWRCSTTISTSPRSAPMATR